MVRTRTYNGPAVKALVYTANNKVEIQSLDDPVPNPDEVVVRVCEAGVCGSDVLGFLGRSKKRVPPLILGHEFAGEVASVGSGIKDLKAGARVAVMPLMTCGNCAACRRGRTSVCPNRKLLGMTQAGGFAELCVAPRRCFVPLPDGMDFLSAAMAEPLATPVNLFENHVRGSIVTAAVFGAGTQGLMAVQMARIRGAVRVFIVDLQDARLAAARKLGATDAINAGTTDPVATINDATQGRGCDVVVDAVGLSPTRRQGLQVTAPAGVFGMIGNSEPSTDLDCASIINREIEVHGVYGYTHAKYERALELIAEKKVDVTTWVRGYPLEDGQKVLDQLASNPGDLVKAAFQP